MTPTFGRPRLVASSLVASSPVTSASDVSSPVASNLPPTGTLPEMLVGQLADALGAAEARCAQRVNIKPISVSPIHRGAEPSSFINAETAPFLTDTPFLRDAGSAPSLLPPSFLVPPALPAHALPLSGAVEGWARYDEVEAEHDANVDLPRFFDRDRPSSQNLRVASPGAAPKLSIFTMALGFVIGLAVVAPTLWLSHTVQQAVVLHGAPMGLQAPLLAASVVATLVPAAALEVGERGGAPPSEAEQAELGLAAFELAARLIANGDYMGARDALRQAVAFGEDRARAMLDALE
jgi:hypothetical protein